jgi:hypothetical protein
MNFNGLSVRVHCIRPHFQIEGAKSTKPCRFAAISGKLLPLSVNLPTQSGKEKLAHLLLHTCIRISSIDFIQFAGVHHYRS